MDAKEYWFHQSVTPDSFPTRLGLKLSLARNVSLYEDCLRSRRAGDSGLVSS